LYEDGPTDEHMLTIKWTCFYDFLQLGQDNEHQQKKSTVQLGISIVFMGYRTFPASLVKYVLKHGIYIYEAPSKSIVYAWCKNVGYRFSSGGPIALQCFVQINAK